MARKAKTSETISAEVELLAASIVDTTLDESIVEQLKEYGTYILQERAIPDYHDGLKPSQRRVLWTLHKAFNAVPSKNHLKCSRVAGGVMQYHPHGDSYPTMVNMIEGTPCPTLDGYGNFGSYSKYAVAGAARYCFHGDTLIATDKGLRRISDFGADKNNPRVSIEDKVLTHKGYKKASTSLYSNVRRIYRVVTRYSTVMATSNEPFRVVNQDGSTSWKVLSKLKPSDLVLVQNQKYSFGKSGAVIPKREEPLVRNEIAVTDLPTKMSCDLAKWLGYVISEASHSKYEIEFSNADQRVVEDYIALCKRLFGKNVRMAVRDKLPKNSGWQRKVCTYVTLKGKGYSLFLQRLGQPIGNSYNRRIPDLLLKGSKSELASFLSSLFEGDGTLGKRGGVSYSSVSSTLISDIQTVLKMFGVRSGISRKALKRHGCRSSKIKGVNREIKLFIQKDDASKFRKDIGFEYKDGDRLVKDRLKGREFGSPTLNDDIAGVLKNIVTDCWEANEYNPNGTVGKSNGGIWAEDRSQIVCNYANPLYIMRNLLRQKSSGSLSDWKEWFAAYESRIKELYPATHKKLKRLIVSFNVEKIEYVQTLTKEDTYDLTVPSVNAYTANGFVVHNTEVRLSEFAMAMFFDKRFSKTYPIVPNFDGSSVEPVYLPTQLPMILALNQMGIAMATTTNIPAFTVSSLYLAVIASLKNKKGGYKLTAKRLSSILKFASAYGGTVVSEEEDILELIKTGKGSIEWECEYDIDESKKQLFIRGIPPGWNFDNKLDRIRNLPMVSECADISEGEEMIVRVSFKQRMSEDDLYAEMDKVIKQLSSKMHYRINITRRFLEKDELVDTAGAKFTAISIIDLLADWVKHRVLTEKKALKVEHGELREKIRHNKLLLLACNKLDIIFGILKRRVKDKVVVLSKALDISEDDARTIWSITVGRLDKLSGDNLKKEIGELVKRANKVKWLYKNPEKSVMLHMRDVRDTITNPHK